MKVSDFFSLSHSFNDQEEFLSETLSSLKSKSKPGDALLATVDYLNEIGRSTQANDLIYYCRDLWPDDQEFAFLASFQNCLFGHYQYSIDLLENIIKASPDFSASYELIAKNLYLSGNFGQCDQILDVNASSVSYQPQTFVVWIEALIQLGRYEDALRTAFSASKRFPEVTDFRVACTECLIRLGHYVEAIGLLGDGCIWTQQIAASLLIELGLNLFLENRYEDALRLHQMVKLKVDDTATFGLRRSYLNYQMVMIVSGTLIVPSQTKQLWKDADYQRPYVVDCRGLDFLSTIVVCLKLNMNRLKLSDSCLLITPYDFLLGEYFSGISFTSAEFFAQEKFSNGSEIDCFSILAEGDFDQNFLVALSSTIEARVSGIHSADSMDSLSSSNCSEILVLASSASSIKRCRSGLQRDNPQALDHVEKTSVSEVQLPHSFVQMMSNDSQAPLSAQWHLALYIQRMRACQKIVTDNIHLATIALLLSKPVQLHQGTYRDNDLQWHWLLNVHHNCLSKMLTTIT